MARGSEEQQQTPATLAVYLVLYTHEIQLQFVLVSCLAWLVLLVHNVRQLHDVTGLSLVKSGKLLSCAVPSPQQFDEVTARLLARSRHVLVDPSSISSLIISIRAQFSHRVRYLRLICSSGKLVRSFPRCHHARQETSTN